ncbi:DUF992 domain-containing protein [Microvirga sp. 0TCS3.31]
MASDDNEACNTPSFTIDNQPREYGTPVMITENKLNIAALALIATFLASAAPAIAQSAVRVGTLACDVSAGIGLFVVQKQTLRCTFTPNGGGRVDAYTGKIDEFGVALGEVAAGHLVWGVIAAAPGQPRGALAETYAGLGAEATLGVGLGANVLTGGTGRAFSLQPISVEGQTGLNIAGGVTSVTLVAANL